MNWNRDRKNFRDSAAVYRQNLRATDRLKTLTDNDDLETIADPEYRDHVRRLILEVEPWIAHGDLMGGDLAWNDIRLAEGWYGLRSIVEAEVNAEIPVRAVLKAHRHCHNFIFDYLLSEDDLRRLEAP